MKYAVHACRHAQVSGARWLSPLLRCTQTTYSRPRFGSLGTFTASVARFLPVFMLHRMLDNLNRTLGTVLLLYCRAAPFHSLEAGYNKTVKCTQ